MSRGRKERTPAQLAVLAQAREKAKIVIAERAKLNALQKTVPSPEPVSEEEAPHLDGKKASMREMQGGKSGGKSGHDPIFHPIFSENPPWDQKH